MPGRRRWKRRRGGIHGSKGDADRVAPRCFPRRAAAASNKIVNLEFRQGANLGDEWAQGPRPWHTYNHRANCMTGRRATGGRTGKAITRAMTVCLAPS